MRVPVVLSILALLLPVSVAVGGCSSESKCGSSPFIAELSHSKENIGACNGLMGVPVGSDTGSLPIIHLPVGSTAVIKLTDESASGLQVDGAAVSLAPGSSKPGVLGKLVGAKNGSAQLTVDPNKLCAGGATARCIIATVQVP